jgi:hypothetical protein
VAMLNMGTFRSLQSVLQLQSIRFKAYLETSAWESAKTTIERTGRPLVLSAEINVYGTMGISDTVGKELMKKDVFLQPPKYDAHISTYENPQYMKVRNIVQEHTLSTVDTVLPCQEHPTETPTDPRIITSLLPYGILSRSAHEPGFINLTMCSHQREAAAFIKLRESGDIPLEQSLWRLCTSSIDQTL